MRFFKTGCFIILIAVTILYLEEQGNIQKRSLELKISDLKQENSQLEHDIESLGQKILKLRTDPKAVEKVAKRKLGMVGPDETIYIFEAQTAKK
ncbi:MAG: septum formation initiator family protein, partial [Deltaproteobacteria bacterium]|nr:septum formation initiator family protein [Deltaproteobacteria bacterium]